MSRENETFFTSIGCMDGRVQDPVAEFGRQKFSAQYADTITEAGLVGRLADNKSPDFLQELKRKLLISLEKHNSKGIVVYGHQECAGNPVEDEKHKDDVRKSVSVMRTLVEDRVPVVGVFVRRGDSGWEVEEVSS